MVQSHYMTVNLVCLPFICVFVVESPDGQQTSHVDTRTSWLDLPTCGAMRMRRKVALRIRPSSEAATSTHKSTKHKCVHASFGQI